MNLAMQLKAGLLWRRRLLVMVGALAAAGTLVASAEAKQRAFHDDLDHPDVIRWERADGWSNGYGYGCGWTADSVVFEGGAMSLLLKEGKTRDRDMTCGEYRTREHFGYGRYATSMKAAKGDGVISAFFLYTGPPFDDPWHETTVEILGRDTTRVQFTYFIDGKQHAKTIELGFDAAEGFHTYAFDWGPDEIRWYVDDDLVHVSKAGDQPLPSKPGRIYAHLWNGDGLEAWSGKFDYRGEPISASYEWIRFVPMAERE